MSFIDDRDPSIVWTGTWERQNQPFGYNQTTSGSKSAGATALVTFTGTNITVYGTFTHGISTSTLPLSTYTLDDGPISGSLAPARPTVDLYHQTFFTSPILPYGTHKLLIKDETNTDTGLWLDYFIVSTVPSASPGATTKVHSSSLIIALSLVIGGSAILSALLLFICIARRRRLKRSEGTILQTTEPFPVQPSFQDNDSHMEPSYGFSGMHRKGELNSSFSTTQRSHVPSESDGSGLHTIYVENEPPMYTEHTSPA